MNARWEDMMPERGLAYLIHRRLSFWTQEAGYSTGEANKRNLDEERNDVLHVTVLGGHRGQEEG